MFVHYISLHHPCYSYIPVLENPQTSNARETHRVSKITKLPVPKAGTCAVLFKRGSAEAVSRKSLAKLLERFNGQISSRSTRP